MEGFGSGVVEVGDAAHPVAVAATPAQRYQGLRGVGDLGELAGMAFVWTDDVTARFVMADTLIPLRIAFVAADGRVIDVLAMDPCTADPCPTHGIDEPYRWALEMPADAPIVEPGDHAKLRTSD